MAFFVYILLCSDRSYYVGHTENMEQRIAEHRAQKHSGYTAHRLPVEVVYCQDFGSRDEALMAERQIKGWRRSKKEALINNDWQIIKELSNLKKRSHPSTQPSRKASAGKQAGRLLLSKDEGSGRTE